MITGINRAGVARPSTRKNSGRVAFLRDHEDRHGHTSADQNAGDDAGSEHGGNRLVCHPCIDYGNDRRRDDRRDDCRGHRQCSSKIEVIALAHHLRHEERAEGRDVSHGGAGNPAEEHAVENIHIGEAAAETADERGGEVDQHACDAAARCNVACENEEGRREQEKGVRQQADEARRDDDRIECRIEEGGAERSDAERQAYGHAEQKENGEDDQECLGHRAFTA